MSNIYSRLHNIFATTQKTSKLTSKNPKFPQTHKPNPTPTIITTKTLSEETPNKAINQKIKELLDEKNPQLLLQKFTDLSQFKHFRGYRSLYSLTINRLALSNQHTLIEQALESQIKYISGSGFATRIIHLYGKYGMFDHARKVFDELPERILKENAKCLVALLRAAAYSEKYEMVYDLFRELPEKLGVKPNEDCYNTVMHALCQMNLVDDAVQLMDEMVENGMMPSVVSYNMLLRVYYGKGEFEEGEKVWGRMIENGVCPNICSYDFKLKALVNGGKSTEATELFVELEGKGLKPDAAIYTALIQCFCKEDNLEGAKRWYNELIASGCAPNKITFSTLVPFLCEKGDYGLAFEVCKTMFKNRHCKIDEAVLQKVVGGLAKNTMVEDAKTLVELGTSSYFPYNLVMPSIV